MQIPIVWRLASSFPTACTTLWQSMIEFADIISTLSDGEFRIEPSPVGEPYGAADLLDLVAEGKIECCHTAGSFFLDRDAVLALATFAPFGLDARRHGAWLAGPGSTHAEAAWARQGLIAVPCGNTGAQTGGWFRAPVTDPSSFQHLRIRTAGLPALVYERLGATPLSLTADAIVPALQCRELDAADWIGPDDDRTMGFYKMASYYHVPGVLEPSAQLSLVINPEAWRQLPERWRSAIRCAAATVEKSIRLRYDTANPVALEALIKDGVTIVRFPPDVIEALRDASAAVLADLRDKDPAFAAALDSYQRFTGQGQQWAIIGEAETADAILKGTPLANRHTRHDG
jgi:TRAP-type mannitol/chloroaromatic compound transport system substrate-binding protein